jgi:nicotinamidase-related amidase
MWQRYYARWRVATRDVLPLELLELMPPFATLCPPATIVDKTRYSAFAEPGLIDHLRQRQADALIVSGSETDVCVLATHTRTRHCELLARSFRRQSQRLQQAISSLAWQA